MDCLDLKLGTNFLSLSIETLNLCKNIMSIKKPINIPGGLLILKIEDIENPEFDRIPLLSALSYNQWTLEDMRSGKAWRELK